MIPPYDFRIMACLPDHTPVELFRSKARYNQKTWDFCTRGLDNAWTCWVEGYLPDNRCISERPYIKHHTGKPPAFHLDAEDKARL